MSKKLHPLAVLVQAAKYIKDNILPFAFLIILQRDKILTYWWIGLIIVGISLFFAFIKWKTFRYEVTEKEIRIKKGVFKKENSFIQLTRIQSIQIDQPFLFRLVRLARLRIETAGGTGMGAEVDLPGILMKDAHELKTMLQAGESLSVEEIPERENIIKTLKVPTSRLVIAAALSANFGYIFAGLGVLYEYVDDLINPWIQNAYEQIITQSIVAIIILVFFILCIAYILSIILYVIRFGNFVVERYEKHLQVQYGLLNKRSLTVPFEKIKAITVEEGLLQRLFGWGAISLKVVTSDLEQKVYLHPFLKKKEMVDVFSDYLPTYHYLEYKPNVVRNYVWYKLLYVFIPACIAVIAISFWKVQLVWGVVILFLAAWLLTWFGYRQGGVMMTREFLSVRSQFITRKTTIMQRRKIQDVKVKASSRFWKKGWRYLSVSTMGLGSSYGVCYLPERIWKPIFDEVTRWDVKKDKV
ncbi:PH domain-containing protein [Priestia flexa]|uniref:PH domain-containing protein n=1 Tax=Priestia flexa TaxID=86664 RepID=UPI00288F8AA8|nr:PH domain-containing protein [Priestia flexa]MDT2047176.1 PH domain-containing protein [Priestia flexa]